MNNLDFDIENALLNTMATEGLVGIRRFGKNDDIVECDCRGMTIFLNGNNIRVVGDMVRRTVTSHINANMEFPGERNFKFDPIEWIRADRGKYLAAIFTIARAYIAAGCPQVEAKPLAGFEGWSRFVRYPLVWLGCPDIATTMEEGRRNDPMREGLRARISALVALFGTTETFSAADVFRKTQENVQELVAGEDPNAYRITPRNAALRDSFAVDRNTRSSSIGTQLMKDVDRVSGGYHVEQVKQSNHDGNTYKMFGEPSVVAPGSSGQANGSKPASDEPQKAARRQDEIPF